ncbi:MAG: 16S rRNA (cytosine(1402)-N(4))-methyltransferase RsmH [Clostridiales bacterium]|nr:16S rRNA (cytosine(1402)-N(4))-methyltransferase RsmH [Clostridiales bacterium]
MTEYHVPVLLDECMQALNVGAGKLYFDGTLGGGGHTSEILRRGGRVIATDRDMEAIDYARLRLAQVSDYNGRYTLVKDNFKNATEVLRAHETASLDGALLDLGISSHQVDENLRGFSYSGNGLLDMRMDRDQYLSAMTVVNEYTEEELSRIIYTYGEERFARKIARAIVETRRRSPIETTTRLADIVKSCVPAGKKGGHPAKKTFQAIRIEVNNELSGLGEAIGDLVNALRPGGRIAVISFHSLEDRIVKQTFKMLSMDCICDKSLPVCVCHHKATVKLIGKYKPSEEETARNERSKSATLRVAEKL